jgi:hypothetical protein
VSSEAWRTGLPAAGTQDCLRGGQAYASEGKFVSNRKLFVLCFQQSAHQDDDFVSFICIE